MRQESTFFGKTELLLISAASCVFIICMYCLMFDPTIFGLWNSRTHKKSNQPIVGQITFLENDTRHQQEGTLVWEQATKKQDVHVGDSIFTGSKSRSQVAFTKGGHVDLGENTMLTFSKIKNETLPNFTEGNFRLKVNGEMKLAIAGEVTQINGDHTEVQIFMDKKVKKPQLKVLKGKALVTQGKAPAVELKVNQVSELRAPANIQEVDPATQAVKIEEPKTVQTLQNADEIIFYTSQLYDFYEKKDNALVRRYEKPNYVNLQKKLSWNTQGDVSKVYGQLSVNPEFDKSVRPFESTQKEFTLDHVFLGANNWRLSLDGKNWTTSAQFFVRSQSLQIEKPKISFSQTAYAIFNQPINVQGLIEAPQEISNFVYEFSTSPQFPANGTRIQWLTKNQLSLRLDKAGSYYIKVRGLNERMEITEFSDVIEIKAARPERPNMPKLAKDNFNIFQGENIQLHWNKTSNNENFEVLIKDKSGNLIESKITDKDKLDWKAMKPGSYNAQISSIDEWGQKSVTSAEASIHVKSKPAPAIEQLQPRLAESSRKTEDRKPSSVPSAQSAMSLNMPDDNVKNNITLTSSKLQIEGAVFSMYAQEKQDKPTVFAFTGRGLNWWGSNGVEGSLKTKVASLDNNSNTPSPLQIEARYHHRWFLPFNPFSSSGNTQFSLVAGYEFYRNPTVGYSPQYDLVKTGFTIDFPVFKNWDTGGEVLYGYGLDQSTKYEISGRFNYYLQRNWSAGFGYRMHMFEAGSNKSAPPQGVPYREAYGEGYSVLRWHY